MVGYKKSIQFNYNANNEPSTIIVIEDKGLQVQRTTTDYFYDAFGRRIAKQSKTETLNKLNQQGKRVKHPTALIHLRKTDKSEYSSTLMLWEGNRQIQEYTNHHIFTTVYDQDSFEPVARIVQARNPIESDKSQETFKVYHYHNNHLGTPQELTDDDGNVVWANYEYAWGGSYQSYYQEQSLNHIAIDKDHLQPLRFQGQYYDSETSLHYNRFRYYDSDVGMFIQRDPIGLLGGVNVFAYAPNPVGWVDPWGLSCAKPHIIKINGRNPINSSYAGKTFYLRGKLAEKYPHGVPFNMFGLPDFSRYAVKNIHIGKPISDYQDFKKANALAFGKNNPYGSKAPQGYVWHHDGEMLRLIPKDIHDAVKHTGSAARHQTRKRKKSKPCTN